MGCLSRRNGRAARTTDMGDGSQLDEPRLRECAGMTPDEALLEPDGVDRTLSDAKLLLGRVRAANIDPNLHVTPVDSPVNAVLRGIWCAFQSRGWRFGHYQLERRVVRSVGRE